MKTPRLLPIVIAATSALLLFKAVGLVTGGGYVLTGTTAAVAAGGGGHGEGGAGEMTMQLPADATMSDTSPTLDGKEPTLPTSRESAGAHGDTEAQKPAAANHGEVAPADTQQACPAVADNGDHKNAQEGPDLAANSGCKPNPGVNAAGDALPLIKNGQGQLVPLAEMEPEENSSEAIVERLGERRGTLDQREHELDMRMALVEAAEKRIDERTAALKALEDKINALLAEKKTADQQQFVGIVAMYETMKPKEAATIFDKLDMPVLLQVARAMSPRKMAPILAKMDPVIAKTLTAGLAASDPTSADQLSPGDLASLPQIVGH